MKKRWGDRWFDPGKTCDQIIEGVNDFFIRNNFDVVETDYTNMDGMTSEWTQLHECLAPLLKIFDVKHHQEITYLCNGLIYSAARTKRFFVYYYPGPGVKSGSPTTTLFNTIFNAVYEGNAIHLTRPDFTYEQVADEIGPKYGDDGLMRACYAKNMLTSVSSSDGLA